MYFPEVEHSGANVPFGMGESFLKMILPPPDVIVREGGRAEVRLFELPFPYDANERAEWKKASCEVASSESDPRHRGIKCSPVNNGLMRSILDAIDLGGPNVLNKKRGAFLHQPECHYSEMKLAAHLVASCGYLPKDMFYENWRMSSSARALRLGRTVWNQPARKRCEASSEMLFSAK